MMPLVFAEAGEVNSIMKVTGSAEVRKHLEDLGFISGSKITVISENRGNLIVNVKDTRIAIDRSMASKIMV